MSDPSQWIHQHSFLLLVCALLLAGLIIISWFRLWTRRTLMIWGSAAVLAAVLLLGLRTPPATVSEVLNEPIADDALDKTSVMNSAAPTDRSLDFSSAEAIGAYLQEGKKPTLVEFYSDFGIG
jgi:hypothetical protein